MTFFKSKQMAIKLLNIRSDTLLSLDEKGALILICDVNVKLIMCISYMYSPQLVSMI